MGTDLWLIPPPSMGMASSPFWIVKIGRKRRIYNQLQKRGRLRESLECLAAALPWYQAPLPKARDCWARTTENNGRITTSAILRDVTHDLINS